MKRLAVLLAALAVLVVPAGAQGAWVQRYVATECPNGNNLRAWKGVPGQEPPTVYRGTEVPCNGYVPDLSKPWYVWNRPQTDLEAANRSMLVWWGHCQIDNSLGSYWGGHPYFGGDPGFYYKWLKVNC